MEYRTVSLEVVLRTDDIEGLVKRFGRGREPTDLQLEAWLTIMMDEALDCLSDEE